MNAILFVAALTMSSLPPNIEAGKYQAVLGDCVGCHGKNLAGGVALQTPFGKLVTPNITPDKETGIGGYTAGDFRKAMKRGEAPGGKLLYPAMPYTYYARMSDADVDTLFDYLRVVKPVKNTVVVNQLHFPFNIRFLMTGWNWLFFTPPEAVSRVAPDIRSDAMRRGDDLVNGPAHCGVCHTPKNIFSANKSVFFSGASLQGWWAPDLGSDAKSGLGAWSAADMVEYLKTGRNAHSLASGPMAEAVENSTSKMKDADLNAIAVYLKDLPAGSGNGGGASGIEGRMKSGAALYQVNCAACHSGNGKGDRVLFPPLAGNAVVMQSSPETLVRVVLAGSKGAATAKAPTGAAMPSFAWKLGDAQVADILTYVRNNWGNTAPAVDAGAVAKIRSGLR